MVCCPVEQSPSCPSTGGSPKSLGWLSAREFNVKALCSKMALERTPEAPQHDPAWHPMVTGLAPRGNPEWFGSEGSFKGHQRIKSHLCWIFQLFHSCKDETSPKGALSTGVHGWGWIVIPSLPWLCAGNRKLSPSWFSCCLSHSQSLCACGSFTSTGSELLFPAF